MTNKKVEMKWHKSNHDGGLSPMKSKWIVPKRIDEETIEQLDDARSTLRRLLDELGVELDVD